MNIPIENNPRPNLKLNDPNNLFLIDGSGYIFRAFYGLPSMSNNDGVPVNAVFGYTKMLLKLIDDFKPIYVAVIFDVARKTFRNDLYDLYKANRSDPPDELIPQFSIIRDATNAIGLPVVEMEGYEADDLIATYSDIASKMNKNVIIVSPNTIFGFLKTYRLFIDNKEMSEKADIIQKEFSKIFEDITRFSERFSNIDKRLPIS